jgi:hypothetical protein
MRRGGESGTGRRRIQWAITCEGYWMTPHKNPAPWRRRLIIVTALALGAVASVVFHAAPLGAPAAYAQAPATPGDTRVTLTAPPPPDVAAAAAEADKAEQAADKARQAADKAADEADAAASRHNKRRGATVGVTVDDDTRRVHVSGLGENRDYESFQDFADNAPWLAALVFLSVTLVFLVPLAVIVLLIWYKIRKNRMLNETMLKLAEKGVMPPTEAMTALGAEVPPQAASPAAGSLYAQARAIRDNRQWSDLRKGVILSALGTGFSAYSLLDSGEANGFGLILLFLGCGYIVLWFMEDRRALQANRPGPGI